jgi:probable HAF family extracellular repeat protein
MARAISDNGEVVGTGPSSVGPRAWRTGPGYGVLPFVPAALNGSTSSACGVNDAGQMVGSFTTDAGSHAFRLETSGSLTDVGTLGGTTSSACGLDADGRVGGQSNVGTETHAFVFSGTTLTDVHSFVSPFSTITTMANGIGVGSFTVSDGVSHALLWDAGGAVDLNSRIPSNSGWVLTDAVAVSPNGKIVGYGRRGDSARVFRLTPPADTPPPPADTTAPVMSSVTADPSSIWPPKGQMVTVRTSAVATDNSGEAPTCTLATVTVGGAAAPDATVIAPDTASVKAVGGRIYTFNERCVDGAGNEARSSVDVEVPADVTAPVIAALTATPSPIAPPNGKMVEVTVSVRATDNVDEAPVCGLVAISAAGATDADFSIKQPLLAAVRAVGGRTYSLIVKCRDAAGNFAKGSVDVKVPPDTTAPVITALSASPGYIWPPNGKMEAVTVSVTATDDVDAAAKCALTSVTGGTAAGAVITGPLTANVRSDKDVVYTLTVGCSDLAGNSSAGWVRVAITKDPTLALSSVGKK